jgi:NADP-dependent 3-hydroxy acid dehydrogenase YdfG
VPNPFLKQEEETFDSVVDINAKGVWLSMKYEIPDMLKTGGGAIVNTASAFGVIGVTARAPQWNVAVGDGV